MADITESTTVRYVNERIRPFADRRIQTYFDAKALTLEFDAKGLAETIKASPDEIDDGAKVDGRKPVTADDVFRMVEEAREFVADFEKDNDKALLYGKIAVNYRS